MDYASIFSSLIAFPVVAGRNIIESVFLPRTRSGALLDEKRDDGFVL